MFFSADSDFRGAEKSWESTHLCGNFTIFEVSKINGANEYVFGYTDGFGGKISIGTNASGHITATVSEPFKTLEASTAERNEGKNHISILKKNSQTINLEYYDSATSKTATDNDSGFNNGYTYDSAKFSIGSYRVFPHLSGQLNELIIFNRALSDTEIAEVRGYLNLKYKIY